MKSSIKAAVCGIFTAFSVVLMFLGGIFSVFLYVVPMVLGIVLIMLQRTFGKSFAITVYSASSILAVFIAPEKELVLMYALFFGCYPIVLPYLEKIKPKFLSVFIKFLIFNISITVVEIICVYVFGIPFFEDNKFSYTMIIVFAIAMNVTFAAYEYCLKLCLLLYINRFEKRIKKFFK